MPVYFVKKAMDVKRVKQDLEDFYGRKLTSLAKYPPLQKSVAMEFGKACTPFVPRSEDYEDDETAGRHLQEFYVTSDGRVIWSRRATDSQSIKNKQGKVVGQVGQGEEIAGRLYEGPIIGHFHKRSAGGNTYGSHDPGPHWAERMKADTGVWQHFITQTENLCREYFGEPFDYDLF